MNNRKVFIIAEIGSNHNQDINRAFELMEIAKDAGADAVKFQSINMNRLLSKELQTIENIRLFNKIKLAEDWYSRLFDYAKKLDIECISAPTYLEAVPLLLKYSNYIKIASPQTYGYPKIIEEVAKSGVNTIMSTGYCEKIEIDRAVEKYLQFGDRSKLTLLHCISHYPTQDQEVNLRYIDLLKKRYNLPVGFSDHTLGSAISIAAVVAGAVMIEKHITISRNDNGPDHFFAIEPKEFKEMVSSIRRVEIALGSGESEKNLTEYEVENRHSLIVYPHANRKLQKGHIVSSEDICYYRTLKEGSSPWKMNEIIGKVLDRDIAEGTMF